MPDNKKLTQNEKDAELYKASLAAFFQNELEHDKIILGLSTAGIGFFIAIFQTQQGKISEVMFISSIISLIMFAITILMILAIFVYNKKQIISIIKGSGKSEEIKALTMLDKTKYLPFAFAIISSMIFTLSLIFQLVNKEDIQMKNTIESSFARDSNKSKTSYEKRGFSEVSSANSREINSSNSTTSSQVHTSNQANQNDSNSSSPLDGK